VQTQSNQFQSIPYTAPEPQQHQQPEHHTTTYQQPTFPSQAQDYQMQSQQPIYNQQREFSSRNNNHNRYNNSRFSSNNDYKQNRSDFHRNRNNNQTNQTSNYPIHNSSNHIKTKKNPNNAPIVCYKCNKVGHYSNNCQNPTNRNQPRIYSNQTNTQTQQQQSTQQLNHQTNNNQTQQQLNSQLNQLTQQQTNSNQTITQNSQPFVPININQRQEQCSRDASPNNRSISPTHSMFNFHQQTQN
jgi:hypothetical protein